MNQEILKDQTVLITGGTGSFGKNFARFLLENFEPKKVIIFSRDELKQFHLQQEIDDPRIRFFIGDIRDLARLERAFQRVDIVIHAAALKQVPALEYNPFEAVKTNVLGSQNVVDAAINQGIKKALLISTDKAAHPVNLYGSTKLCAEKLFINGNMYSGGRTKFSVVRYGNVIGSRGSIVDHLLKNPNLAKVQITHEKMTRFWITLEQASNLVLFALKNMAGGEIFIPKIPSMNLADLFQVLAPKAEKEIIGIRPGEKLHETLLTNEESRHALELENYYLVLPEYKQMFNMQERYKDHFAIGKKLAEDFNFTSKNNKNWLAIEDLTKIIADLKI